MKMEIERGIEAERAKSLFRERFSLPFPLTPALSLYLLAYENSDYPFRSG